MKQVSSMSKIKIRNEQFEVLVDIFCLIKNRSEMKKFLQIFLSESESAYLSQRLDIMRMLAKKFNYRQIKEILRVPSPTITHANSCLEAGGKKVKKIILSYKYKGDAKEEKTNNVFVESFGNGLVSPHMPGAIGGKKYKK